MPGSSTPRAQLLPRRPRAGGRGGAQPSPCPLDPRLQREGDAAGRPGSAQARSPGVSRGTTDQGKETDGHAGTEATDDTRWGWASHLSRSAEFRAEAALCCAEGERRRRKVGNKGEPQGQGPMPGSHTQPPRDWLQTAKDAQGHRWHLQGTWGGESRAWGDHKGPSSPEIHTTPRQCCPGVERGWRLPLWLWGAGGPVPLTPQQREVALALAPLEGAG